MKLHLVVAASLAASVMAPAASANDCATGHLGVRWAAFQPPVDDFGPAFLYWAAEPDTGNHTAELTIRANPEGSCTTPPQPATATYTVNTSGSDRPAAPLADYETVAGNTGPLYDHRQPPNEHSFGVTIHSDGPLPEPVAERTLATITFTDGKPEHPQEAPLWIIDADGLSRASLESAGPYRQEEQFRQVEVPVFRGGDASQPLVVEYSVAGSSQAPATPGEDFTITSAQPLVFAPGERVQLITLSLRADGVPEPMEQATVAITSPSTLDPSDPVVATVEIVDSIGGYAPPTSRLHHPRHRLRYPADDYRLREIHVFTQQGGGGVVTEAELAIRQNRSGGTCRWLQGRRFRPGGCSDPRWIPSDGQYEPDFFYVRLRRLAPTGDGVKSYTALTRAIDAAQSAEFDMERGRNANTFKVKRAGT